MKNGCRQKLSECQISVFHPHGKGNRVVSRLICQSVRSPSFTQPSRRIPAWISRDRTYTVTATVGQLLDLAGEENVKTFLQEKAGEASYKAEYEMSKGKITSYWMHLCSFIILFALLAMITLEFIDKDRR